MEGTPSQVEDIHFVLVFSKVKIIVRGVRYALLRDHSILISFNSNLR